MLKSIFIIRMNHSSFQIYVIKAKSIRVRGEAVELCKYFRKKNCQIKANEERRLSGFRFFVRAYSHFYRGFEFGTLSIKKDSEVNKIIA